MCVCVYVCVGHMCGRACLWRQENNLRKSVFFFYYVGPGIRLMLSISLPAELPGSLHLMFYVGNGDSNSDPHGYEVSRVLSHLLAPCFYFRTQ